MQLVPPGVSPYVPLTAPRRARALRWLAYTHTHTCIVACLQTQLVCWMLSVCVCEKEQIIIGASASSLYMCFFKFVLLILIRLWPFFLSFLLPCYLVTYFLVLLFKSGLVLPRWGWFSFSCCLFLILPLLDFANNSPSNQCCHKGLPEFHSKEPNNNWTELRN